MTKLEKVIKELQWLQSNFPLQDKPEDDADRMCNAIHKYSGDAIALLESQQWISVKDRLPPEDKMVLVWHWDYEIGCLESDPYIHELRWSFNDFNLYGEDMEQVIAWMPLPEPPKEDKA